MLQFARIITTVDAHTAGEPLRIITSGYPLLKGKTMLEKRRYVKENYDHLRKLLMLEPRGHSGMYGCLVTAPSEPDGDFGVLFMHNEGYSTMCGHGIIAITKVAVETGMIDIAPGKTLKELKIDTPAGRITALCRIRDGMAVELSFYNVPSFVYREKLAVPVGGLGEVKVDIAFGGAFYALVDAGQLNLKVASAQAELLAKLGMEIKDKVAAMLDLVHPEEPELCGLYGTIITEDVEKDSAGNLISKNVTIFADAQIDRSPTGTGTAARVALLHKQGKMRAEATLQNRSIIDTVFEARIHGFTKVGDYDALIPEISGSAQITGYHNFVLEQDDPLPEGFRLI